MARDATSVLNSRISRLRATGANLLTAGWCAIAATGAMAADATLAVRLSSDGQHEQSAIEFRRLALSETNAVARGTYYWAAAFQYWCTTNRTLTLKMLDRAEDETPLLKTESLVLRGQTALDDGHLDEARFYFESALKSSTPPELRPFAVRKLAHIALLQHDLPAAREWLNLSDAEREISAVNAYERTSRKKPVVGGLLGMVPGLGYAYSGEYANALRSLILNGIFIYGLTATAHDEDWGAFSVIAFFELTWYTGSIYGGIDSAHRYNRNQLRTCVDTVDGRTGFEPNMGRLPLLSITFRF